MTGAAALTLNN